jgi:hypothetical protein
MRFGPPRSSRRVSVAARRTAARTALPVRGHELHENADDPSEPLMVRGREAQKRVDDLAV